VDDLSELLRREYAGLPVWAWLLVGLVGVGVGLAVRRRFALGGDGDDPTAEPVNAGGVDPITGLSYGAEPIGGLTLGQDFATPYQGSTDGLAGDEGGDGLRTNSDWLADASEGLRGRYTSVLIDTSLRKYLNGQPLNPDEVSVVDSALREFGPPPGGAPPVDLVAPPVDDTPGQDAPTGGGGDDTQAATEQRVRDLFARYGVPLAANGETADQRVARIARELRAGDRTWADVERAVRWLRDQQRRDDGDTESGTTSGGSSSTGQTYTIRSGDTLSSIARRFDVDGGWSALYQANRSTIDAEARRRGRTPSPNLIFPGTVLRIP